MKKNSLEYRYLLQGKRMILTLAMIAALLGCKEFVEIDSVTDKFLAEQVFDNDGSANNALNGIYVKAKGTFINYTSLYNTLSSDDFTLSSSNSGYDPYRYNNLLPTTTLPWSSIYNMIYAANSAIEGIAKSNAMSEKAKRHYLAEAKFNRAFCYFYLVNLFGDVPLVLTTDVTISASLPKVPAAEVYAQIISDLQDARNGLPADYSFTGNSKDRANKWAATAMLARVYLYLKNWANAEAMASEIINSGQYSLLNSPVGIFEKDNTEAILQWANNSTESNTVATNFISASIPPFVCTSFLLNAFEAGDRRRTTWINSKVVASVTYTFPFKFTSTAVTSTERYTVLRLAEQYLIRSEAQAMLNNLSGAMADINLIRSKHGGLLTPIAVPSNQQGCLDVIFRERQVDLFMEGMHRWFDLKRTGRIDIVMQTEKPATWKSTDALYPIPLADIQRNPRLIQNDGY